MTWANNSNNGSGAVSRDDDQVCPSSQIPSQISRQIPSQIPSQIPNQIYRGPVEWLGQISLHGANIIPLLMTHPFITHPLHIPPNNSRSHNPLL